MTPLLRAGALSAAGILLTFAAPASAQTHPLVVSRSAFGTVTSTPAGIECGASCSASFPAGATVTLTAAAVAPATFGGWSGGCTGTASTCVVTLSEARFVTPDFRSDGWYALALVSAGTGIGAITSSTGPVYCSGSSCGIVGPPGTVATLGAVAAEGSVFTGWSGACAGAAETCTLVLTESQTAVATFEAPAGYVRLDVTANGSVVSEPAGIRCPGTCSALFPSGTAVTLTATPPGLGSLQRWGGACSGRELTCVVPMTQQQAVTADFIGDAVSWFVVAKSGTGSGRIVSRPAGIDCGSTCGALVTWGTTVTLAASTSAGSAFAGWSGACTGSAPACVFSFQSSSAPVTARFLPADGQTLAVTIAGLGAVQSTPAGLACWSSTCSQVFATGTAVTLTATAVEGSSVFVGWGGACAGDGPTCTVSMAQAQTVTATFSDPQLTVSPGGEGSGTVTLDPPGTSCGTGCARYPPGTTVTLTPVPRAGSRFVGWGGDCTGSGACQVSMSASRNVSVIWALLPTRSLTVTKSGTGTGTVTSSPSGVSCGATCTAAFPEGATVTLHASPASGSAFHGWTGACTGAGPCVVLLSAAREVTAVFLSGLPRLTIVKTGTGSGTITSTPAGIDCGPVCSATFAYGSIVNLAAVPAPGSGFMGWTGCQDGGSCDGGADMTKHRTVTAVFEKVSGPPCEYAIPFSWNTGNLGSAASVCYRASQTIHGWGCSSFAGRTISVNGGPDATTCRGGPLGKWADGYTYFFVSGGGYPWASIYVW